MSCFIDTQVSKRGIKSLVVTVVEAITCVCKVCGVEKPVEDFPKIHEYRGRSCKKCYYILHKERIAIYGKEHYAQNRIGEIEKAKARYRENRERILLRLHNRRLSGEFVEIYRQRDKERNDKVRNTNLETYGTACSPAFTAKIRENERKKRAINKETIGFVYPEALREKRKLHYLELRKQALEYYGAKCECCGEARYEMLTFDHKVKTYYKDKVRGVALTYDVIREYEKCGYPNEKYRVLCWNCNMSDGHYGYCPHNTQIEYNYAGKAIKLEMIQAYGGKCKICGDNHWEFLTIDHINGNGNKHRSLIGAGMKFYKYLKQEGWPQDEYRLLCGNCNCNKGGTD